jgi:HlyD family secretion protein
MVNAGQSLASLAQTSLAQGIILAQVDLINAQKALEELEDTDLALAQAEKSLADAQKRLKDTQYRFDNIDSAAPEVDIDSAKAAVTLANSQLDKAQDRYRPYEKKSEDNVIRATLLNQVAEAQKKYDAAVRRLNNLLGTTPDTDVAVINADLNLAQTQVAEFLQEIERLKSGPDPDDILALQTRILAAQATLNLATLTAPFSGTVTAVKVKVGDQVQPGTPAFRLDDLSHLLVDVNVPEVDINRVELGQGATLTFDSTPGKEYQGVVVEVSPVGAQALDAVEFMVTLELTDPDQDVRPGMTAAVNFIVEQINGVLQVPNRAVRILDGKRVVYLLVDDTPTPVEITLGASSDTMSEIISGDLKAGDEVILNPPVEFENSGPPFMR